MLHARYMRDTKTRYMLHATMILEEEGEIYYGLIWRGSDANSCNFACLIEHCGLQLVRVHRIPTAPSPPLSVLFRPPLSPLLVTAHVGTAAAMAAAVPSAEPIFSVGLTLRRL